MNVVLIDSGQLAGDPDFPEINLPKFGWSQFVDLPVEEIDERCWRADIIISTNTAINAQVISESYKLKLILAAGAKTDHIDIAAAKARGITVCNVPGLTADNVKDSQIIADQLIDNIHAWLNDEPTNVVE